MSVPKLRHVVVMFLSSIAVLIPSGNFCIVPTLHPVRDTLIKDKICPWSMYVVLTDWNVCCTKMLRNVTVYQSTRHSITKGLNFQERRWRTSKFAKIYWCVKTQSMCQYQFSSKSVELCWRCNMKKTRYLRTKNITRKAKGAQRVVGLFVAGLSRRGDVWRSDWVWLTDT